LGSFVKNDIENEEEIWLYSWVNQEADDDSTDLGDWWTINSLLVSWIQNTIKSSLYSMISHVEIAWELWNDIRNLFSLVNGPRIHQIKSNLVECRQEGISIVNYYKKLKQLWDALANYDQPCKCGGCTYDLGSILDKKREEERVDTFLMGLDDIVYDTVHSNILAHNQLPNLNKFNSILIQEERVQTMARGKEDIGEVMTFTIRGRVDGKVM